MKHKNKVIAQSLLAVSLLLFWSCNVSEEQTVTRLTKLVMADEFSTNGAPDPSMWTYDIGTGNENTGFNGWGNNELQYYTDRPENIRVEDGNLVITAIQESFEGSAYTSARLVSRGLFTQQGGRFEARMQLPWGRGLWSAFWLLGDDCDTNPWPNCGEIDIMENRGQQPTLITGSIHGPGYSAGESISKEYTLEDDRFDTGFHIFGIEWGRNFINYYVDDVLYNQLTPDDLPTNEEWIFNDPDREFYIILNLAVGGDFVGSPNANTVFPQTMLVDYVRIYE